MSVTVRWGVWMLKLLLLWGSSRGLKVAPLSPTRPSGVWSCGPR